MICFSTIVIIQSHIGHALRHNPAVKLSPRSPSSGRPGTNRVPEAFSRGFNVTKFHAMLLLGASALVLTGCGAGDVASPGTGGNVTINNPPAPAPAPTPTPTSSTVVAAAGCPTIADPQGLTDGGTISGPTGSYRVCRLPSLIRTSISLPRVTGLVYEMNGRVNVGCDGGFGAPTAGAPVTS